MRDQNLLTNTENSPRGEKGEGGVCTETIKEIFFLPNRIEHEADEISREIYIHTGDLKAIGIGGEGSKHIFCIAHTLGHIRGKLSLFTKKTDRRNEGKRGRREEGKESKI